MKNQKNGSLAVKIIFRLPALIITAVSFYLSAQPSIPMPSFAASDKIVHLVCFAGLAFSVTWWFSRESRQNHPLKVIVLCTAIVLLYGILDEFHQSFVFGRTASVYDWLADTVGAIAGSVVSVVSTWCCIDKK